jgi:nucleoside-diphosphate-sugar epimerase
MRILLVGAAGAIGSAVEAALGQKHEIIRSQCSAATTSPAIVKVADAKDPPHLLRFRRVAADACGVCQAN